MVYDVGTILARTSNYVLVKHFLFQFYGAEKECNVVTIGNRPGKR